MLRLPLRALALAALFLAACGGDDDGDGGDADGPPADAALGADSSEILPDANATTSCGNDEYIMYCDRATEICVEHELGAGIVWNCTPLPDGCDATRDCASCADVCDASEDCIDSDQDNNLTCSCPECA